MMVGQVVVFLVMTTSLLITFYLSFIKGNNRLAEFKSVLTELTAQESGAQRIDGF